MDRDSDRATAEDQLAVHIALKIELGPLLGSEATELGHNDQPIADHDRRSKANLFHPAEAEEVTIE